MAPKSDTNKRKPARIFSFDNLKSSSSRSLIDKVEHGPSRTMSPKPLIDQTIEQYDRGNSEPADQDWTEMEMVESPLLSEEPSSSRTSSLGPDRRVNLRKLSTPVNLNLSENPSLESRPQARWEHLRQHVLGASTRPATPPTTSSQPSPTVSTYSLPGSRAQTPKPSRFARLGFRHIVDQARELEVDETRMFATELQNICWSIRAADGQRARVDREPSGSSLHIPFLSNTSFSTLTGPIDNFTYGSNNLKKHELRRPQSVLSLAHAQYSTSSIRPLYQILLDHATPSLRMPHPTSKLPLETLVLSTLLTPFTISEGGAPVDDDKRLAAEAFNLIIRTWPVSDEGGVQRCLWCCQAASIPSASRTAVLGLLRDLLDSGEASYFASKLDAFQTLAQALLTILPAVPRRHTATSPDDSRILDDAIVKLRSGHCGDLDVDSVQKEYSTVWSANETTHLLRSALFLDSLSRCLEHCADNTRLWLLQYFLEQNWISIPGGLHFTPLLAAIHARTLKTLGRALLSLLSVPADQDSSASRVRIITELLQTKIIPEMDALGDELVSDARISVVNIILSLIRNDVSKSAQWSISIICQWYRGSTIWKSSIEKTLQSLIAGADWPNLLHTLLLLIKIFPDEPRKPLVVFALPLLHDRLVEEPPAHPCPLLTSLLDTIARLYPQVFYKLLFSCAASSKEFTVVNYLCAMVVVSKFLPDFWTRDAEMMAIALMSDVRKKDTVSEDAGRASWTNASLGQCVLLVELIGRLQAARHQIESSPSSDSSLVEVYKFALELETRLSILLDVKEQTNLLTPPSQRLLFCMLFREIRLLTRSLKPAPLVSRVILWFIDVHLDDDSNPDPEEEEMRTIGQLRGLYAAAHDGACSPYQRRSTVLLSKTLERPSQLDTSSAGGSISLAAIFGSRSTLLDSLTKGFVAKAMKLLVVLSTLLTPSDYQHLGPYLWQHVQSESHSSTITLVCFLIMQCAEKTPLDLLATMEVDLQSSNNATKLAALRKISILINWRFQVMSPHVITDRSHRPFKLARGPLPFVAMDIGSSAYVHDEDPNELKDNIPSELRKRLIEMGWDRDDTPVNQQREWMRTPMSLLPTLQLDLLNSPTLETFLTTPSSPNSNSTTSPTPDRAEELTGLLRRNSSSGGPTHILKRRAVFVSSLTAIFPRLASLVFDPNYTIAFAARAIIIDLMRNDPALLVRPVLDLLVDDQRDMQSAMLGMNAFLHVQQILPSPMSHYLFNHLAGFLKYIARYPDGNTALQDFAHTIPVLAKLVAQVSGMSIREIRRAKVEPFLIPSGSLWFLPSAPIGPMFPRGPSDPVCDPFNALAPDLVSMTMIRTSQNLLFLSMLQQNRQDVQLVRKNMSQLVLPSAARPFVTETLGLSDFVPYRSRNRGNVSFTGLSLMISRSYLLLVAQVFRSMPRHVNDRNELAVLVYGLNKILLAHGDDIGIVSQVMIALMVASTRFRRLFTSGGGYGLFMPAVIKVYVESEGHIGIRLAIEYAVNRFFALHADTFIFQSLNAVAHIATLPDIDGEMLAKNIYILFSALRRGVLPSTPDLAGIHNANKPQEREALLASTAEEKPQTFLASLRRPQGQNRIMFDLPEEYESNRLGIDNFVRLFLTVIAHDPSTLRAEQFLRLFRYMTQYLYHSSSSARTILQEGIDALGVVLSRAAFKVKPADSQSTPADTHGGFLPMEIMSDGQLLEKPGSPSDILSMRLDYLLLIAAYTRAGGQLSQLPTLRALDLVRLILDSPSSYVNDTMSIFFTEFTHHSLLRENPPSVKFVVAFLEDLAPVIRGHMTAVDFSGVFKTITILASNPMYANDLSFSQVVVTQICTAGLVACELAASENLLLSFPCRSSLVTLLGQSVLLRGSNIISELEKRTPSYGFLTGVVFPLVMSLKTGEFLSEGTRTEPFHRGALTNAWLRLLSYSMSACEDFVRRPIERLKSQGNTRSNDSKHIQPAFLVALQILKVIIVRAEPDLTSHLPGLWARLASSLTLILRDGDATLSAGARDISPLPSPTASPRASDRFNLFRVSTSKSALGSPSSDRSFWSPRAIDYALWSFLELLCLYRNPLMLQMRILVFEKLVELDQILRYRQGMQTPGSRPGSVFSKFRRRRYVVPSPSSSYPSPRLSPSQTLPYDTSFSFREQQTGDGTPSNAPSDSSHHPNTVHLGPIPPTAAFGRGGATGMDTLPTATKIESPALVRATYRRIRAVQRYMGYEPLLPMPPHSHGIDVNDEFLKAWTRKQALDAILQETRELSEEFEGFNQHDALADPFVI